MIRVLFTTSSFILLITMMTGCRSTYNVKRTSPLEIASEGTIVFVRPTKYSPLIGTKSLHDYVEVTHETATRNRADLLQVSIGLRDIGGKHWWDLKGPDFLLSIKTVFYDRPYNAGGQTSVPVYETNWRTVKMLRGATSEYKVICPRKEGAYYQVTISELLH